MGRKKKSVENVNEVIVPMKEDAMNEPVLAESEENEVIEEASDVKEEIPTVEEKVVESEIEEVSKSEPEKNDDSRASVLSSPTKMRIHSSSSLVNVRQSPNGDVLFRIANNTPVLVEEEKDGWCKITGYVMKELVGVL